MGTLASAPAMWASQADFSVGCRRPGGGRARLNRSWIVLMGLLSIAAGIVVLVWPGISLLTLAVVLGVWLLVLGILEIVFAFQLRSLGRTVGQMASAT
jgi:uncharacterized membrane protein HdeD (DUF308 family)